MKILVTESQYKKLFKEEKEQKIFRVPRLKFFDENPWEAWQILQKILQRRGYPPYTIDGDLQLDGTPIQSLGNLTSVGGDLDLRKTQIKSLGNLQSVGRDLDLRYTPIESLGNLQIVGGFLDFQATPLSKMYTEEQIREMVNVDGDIYL